MHKLVEKYSTDSHPVAAEYLETIMSMQEASSLGSVVSSATFVEYIESYIDDVNRSGLILAKMPKCTSRGVKRNKKGIEVQVGEFLDVKNVTCSLVI